MHRGRIWCDATYGWRYACHECNFGAGSNARAEYVFPWLIRTAMQHAHASLTQS